MDHTPQNGGRTVTVPTPPVSAAGDACLRGCAVSSRHGRGGEPGGRCALSCASMEADWDFHRAAASATRKLEFAADAKAIPRSCFRGIRDTPVD